MKSKPLLKLTKKQKEHLKAVLDSRLIACSLSLYAGSQANEQTDKDLCKQKFDVHTDRYDEIINALSVLGIEIEPHKKLEENQ